MLVPEQGLWLGTDVQLGPPILKVIDVAAIKADPPPAVVKGVYTYVELGRLEALEQRVATLEASTWAARWARFVAWCRHVYDRFMEQ